jgi:hypothetical protein
VQHVAKTNDRGMLAERSAVSEGVGGADQRTVELRDNGGRWAEVLFVVGTCLYLYVKLFTFRGIPVLLGGDQIFFWMDAKRLLLGERIYLDFFQFTPPGTDVIYLAFFKLFGPRIWVPNLIVLILGVLFGWVCFRISVLFLKTSRALLAASLFTVFIYGTLLNATHHLFSELAVLGAVAVLIRGKSWTRVALAGMLLGLATFFTQTRGPIAALAIATYFTWDQLRARGSWFDYFRRLALLFSSLIFSWLTLSSYFIATVGLGQIWKWQVDYVLHQKVAEGIGFGLPHALSWSGLSGLSGLAGDLPILLVCLMLPVVYGVTLWHCWRERGAASSASAPSSAIVGRLALFAFVGIATALEMTPSLTWFRLYCVAAPAVLLFVWAVGRVPTHQRLISNLLWIGLCCFALGQTWSLHRHQFVILDAPAGTVAAYPEQAEKLSWIAERTKPGDYFFQAGWPGVYLPLDLNNPVYAESLSPFNTTIPEIVERSIGQLESRQVRYILWAPFLNSPMPPGHPEVYHLTPLRDFMNRNYQKVWTFADGDEVWERK